MGMNVGSGSGSGEPEVMMDINTTPLIDVMLVLLVMLIACFSWFLTAAGQLPRTGGSVMKPTLAMPARWQA